MARVDGNILNSDYDTLKNDADGSGVVIFPGSFVVPGNGMSIFTTDIPVGDAQSFLNVRVNNNKEGAKYYVASVQQQWVRTGIVTGFPATYTLFFVAYHAGGNNVRLQAFVPNPYSDPLTCAGGNEVFTALIKTFKTPSFS